MTDILTSPIPSPSEARLRELILDVFGFTGPFRVLDGERDLNLIVETGNARYTVKIANAAERPGILEFQAAALDHIAVVDADLPVPRTVPTRHGAGAADVDIDGVMHQIRALTFVEGTPIGGGAVTATVARSIGAIAARLQLALRGFFHPAAGRRFLWDARNAADLVEWTDAIPDAGLRRTVRAVLGDVARVSAPRLAALPAQVVHNDLHRGNLLVHAPTARITGVIDFGDLIHTPRIQDLAVAATYAALEHPDPLAVVCAVVQGFSSLVDLEPDEIEVLPGLISIRLAQSITIGRHRAVLHPENAAYILIDAPHVEAAISAWTALDDEEVRIELRRAAGIPHPPGPTSDLSTRRSRSLWSGLRLSYDEPAHLVRGDGVWVHDASGRRYLDAYNNVVQAGHGNRRVVAAASRQALRLNTNTRYLTEPVVDLAERLGSLLPEPLEVCFFVNSGTEANDLAWRIARTLTGNSGAVVTRHAYHGWSDAIYALSPEERPGGEVPPHVAVVAAPGTSGPSAADAIARLVATGHGPAAAMVDATFSSDGIRDPGSGYLDALAGAVRDAGGLFIADEVQGGLGRVGPAFWAFAAADTIPDIVTLGKPLGNGYPIGAVVTSRAIADAFAARSYFFSTFGGNPVAAAAARTVLDITAELDLPMRAASVGAMLRRELPQALAPLPRHVAVRGRGAFVGVDIGDGVLARSFVEALRTEGVLVGRTGPGGTVVKIRPPLVFDVDHAAHLLEAAESAARRVGEEA